MSKRHNLLRLVGLAGALIAANQLWNRRFTAVSMEAAMVPNAQGRYYPGRRVRVQSRLDAAPEAVWQAVQKKEILSTVSAPVLIFLPRTGEPLAALWQEGEAITLDLKLLGVLPLGEHTIRVAELDEARHTIATQERGDLAQVWNHRIVVEPAPGGGTRYTDEIGIYAGPLTLLVAAFAHFFYRYRQTRWQMLGGTLRLDG